MKVTVMIVALLACSALASKLRAQPKTGLIAEMSETESFPMTSYKRDCWQKRPVSKFAGKHSFVQKGNSSYPGAGIDGIDEFKPYERVEKDGFMALDCVLDRMVLQGDKFGPNKHDYTLGDSHGVSVVHYDAHVEKDPTSPKPMTQKLCFEFCRTVPDMLFFGLRNGRDCYCTPFYEQSPGDSSACDSTCEGEPTLICGGKKKSSIFSMHFCDTTGDDLGKAADKALDMVEDLTTKVDKATTIYKKMNEAAEKNQKTFGKAGDPAAGDLMQAAKVYAGDMEKAVVASDKLKKALKGLADDAAKITDFTVPAEITKAERVMEDIEKTLAEAVVALKSLEEELATAQPGPVSEGATKQYLSLMYFVDKKFADVQQTCSGEIVDTPIGGLSKDGCASACDAQVHDCKGFAYFDTGAEEDRVCFLFSSFKSAVYYTGCDAKMMLLQKASKVKGGGEVTCMAKLTEYQGQDLSPQGGGKCKACLKKVVNADRCY